MNTILNNTAQYVNNNQPLANKFRKVNTYTVKKEPIDPREIIPKGADLLHVDLFFSDYISGRGILNLYPGYVINHEIIVSNNTLRLLLEEKDEPNRPCPHCGCIHTVKHGHTSISLRDSPLGIYKVIVNCKIKRYKCRACNATFVNPISFKHPCHNITMRLYSIIAAQMSSGNVSASALEKSLGISRQTITAIDKANCINNLRDIPTDKLRYIAIDEHSIFKNHHYITIILDAQTSQLLYACTGKTKKDLEPFFKLLKERGHDKNILGVSCDCNAGFINMFKEHCPNARIVIDEFHVIKYFNEAVHNVRVSLKKDFQNNINKLQKLKSSLLYEFKHIHDKSSDLAAAIEQQMCELQTNIDTLKEEFQYYEKARWFLCKGLSKTELEIKNPELLKFMLANEDFKELLQIGDELRALWHTPFGPNKIKELALNLVYKCRCIRFAPIKSFAEFINRHIEHIIYASSTGLSNSRTEGVCAALKAFQRVTRGVKDVVYYIAKIHALFSKKRKSKLVPIFTNKEIYV